jgi:hypothetical protein
MLAEVLVIRKLLPWSIAVAAVALVLVLLFRPKPRPLPPVTIPVEVPGPLRESLMTCTTYIPDPELTRERDRWRKDSEGKQDVIDRLLFRVESMEGRTGMLPEADSAIVADAWKMLRVEYRYGSNTVTVLGVKDMMVRARTEKAAPRFSVYGTDDGMVIKRGWPVLLGLGASLGARAWPESFGWDRASLFAAIRVQQWFELDAGVKVGPSGGLESFAEGRCAIWF